MQKKIFSNNFKTFISRLSRINLKEVPAFSNSLTNKSKFNTLMTFPKRFFVQGDLNRVLQQSKYSEENQETDENPVTNFLFSELNKINEKNFNVDEFCLGLRSLENIRLSVTDLHRNIKEITYMFESIINYIVSNQKLNRQNADIFVPQIAKTFFMYSIDSNSLRKDLNTICIRFCNDLSYSTFLYLLKLNEIKKDKKDKEIAYIFFDRFKKEHYNLNCQELTESTIIFFELIQDQDFLNNIQSLIINYGKEVDNNNYNDLVLLFNRILKNRSLNLDILFEHFINNILKNFVILNSDTQVKVLSAYALYHITHTNPNTNKSVSKNMEDKIKKLFKYGEEEMMNCIRNLKMDECIEVLNSFFQIGHGSKELFEEIEKHIGLNILSLSPEKIFIVLNTFVLSGKMRNKFTLLLQKRIVDIKEEFNISELTKILRIYTSIETQYEYIYEKCENYFLSMKEYLNHEDLANLVFAYSNPHIKGKYFILNDLEEVIQNKIDFMLKEKSFEPMVDILYSYLLGKKGAKKFIEKIFVSLINTQENLNLSSTGLFKLYYIFVEMKTPLSTTVRYDNLLLEKIVNLQRDEIIAVNGFLRSLNYSNIDTLTIIDNITKLEMSGLSDEEKRDKKVQMIIEFGINPIYDHIRF